MDESSLILSSRKIWEDGPLCTKEIISSVKSLLYHQNLTDILKEVQGKTYKRESKYPLLTEEFKFKPSDQIIGAISSFIHDKTVLQGCQAEQLATLTCLDTLKTILCEEQRHEDRNCYSAAFLTQKNHSLLETLIMVMHKLYLSDKLDLNSFTHVYYQLEDLPLEVLWAFQEATLIDFNSYIIKNLCHPQEISKLTSSLSAVICNGGGVEDAEKMCVGLLLPLIAAVYGTTADDAKSDLGTKKQALKIVLSSVMRKMNEQILTVDPQDKTKVSGNGNVEANLKPVDVYHLLALSPDLGGPNSQMALGFLSSQLADLLIFSPGITLNQAFTLHSEWSYCKISQHLCQMLKSLLGPLETKNTLEIMRTVLKMGEVNWRNVLACISVFSVMKDESGMYMKDFISTLVCEAFNDSCHETLILALLTARQCSLEGCGFPPYGEWLELTFGPRGTWGKVGDQRGNVSGRNFQLYLSLITDLVPVESIMGLRAHISHPPQAPASAVARGMLSDYVHLARTRLSDFGVCLSDHGGLFRTSQLGGSEVTDVNQGLAAAEVEYVLSHFEKTGEVLRTVFEASVFRKRYLEQTFLPELLKPRIIPEEPDARMKVINILSSKGLISAAMFKDYCDQCEEEKRRKPGKRECNMPVERFDSVASLCHELEKHLEIIRRLRSGNIVPGESQMWKSLKDSLAIVNQSLHKALALIPKDSQDDMHFTMKDSKVIKSADLINQSVSPNEKQIITAFLDTFKDGLEYFTGSEKMLWLQLMLVLLQPHLVFSLYQQLYQWITEPLLEMDYKKIDCMAAVSLSIVAVMSDFPAILLSTNKEFMSTQEDVVCDEKIVPFFNFLSQALPTDNRHKMEHSLCFCESFLGYVENLVASAVKDERKIEVVSHIPHVLFSKYLYLVKRFQYSDVNHSFKFLRCYFSNPGIWQDIMKNSQVQLKEWLCWELSIDTVDDIFSSLASKKDYLLHCLLNFCTLNSSCNTLSVIKDTMTAIISTWSSGTDSLGHVSSNFVMLLSFQEFISHKLECVTCSFSSGHEAPWLLEYWMDMKREKYPMSSVEKKENGDWILLRIVNTLPTYLIIKNDPSESEVTDLVKDTIILLINKHLRESLCYEGFLPQSFMLYLVGGIIDYDSNAEATINYIIRMSPTFKMALLAHHTQLQSKLGKLKDIPDKKELHMIFKVIGRRSDSQPTIPLANQKSVFWEVALAFWAKKKAQFPSPEVVMNRKVSEEMPLHFCCWIMYFDMLSVGWNDLFRGKSASTLCLNSLTEMILQHPALVACLDSLYLPKQHLEGPNDHSSPQGILSVAHSTCKLLIPLLSSNQPGCTNVDSWMMLLRTLLSARIQWGKYNEEATNRFELILDMDLRSILSHAVKMAKLKSMSLSEQLPSEYLSGLDKTITKGIV